MIGIITFRHVSFSFNNAIRCGTSLAPKTRVAAIVVSVRQGHHGVA